MGVLVAVWYMLLPDMLKSVEPLSSRIAAQFCEVLNTSIISLLRMFIPLLYLAVVEVVPYDTIAFCSVPLQPSFIVQYEIVLSSLPFEPVVVAKSIIPLFEATLVPSTAQ